MMPNWAILGPASGGKGRLATDCLRPISRAGKDAVKGRPTPRPTELWNWVAPPSVGATSGERQFSRGPRCCWIGKCGGVACAEGFNQLAQYEMANLDGGERVRASMASGQGKTPP